MPQVVAGAVIAGALAAGTALPWLATAAFAKAFVTSLVLGGLSHALAKKPKTPTSVNQVNSNTIAFRQPASTRKFVYGHTRIADIYAHMQTTGENEKLHAFVVLCDNEVEAIDEIWVNDYVIPPDWIDGDGNVTDGRYAGKLRIRKHLGSPDQVADSVAVAEIADWTTDHRGRGVAYLYVTATKDTDVFPTGFPNFSAIVRGKKIFNPATGLTKFTTNASLFAYDYLNKNPFGFLASDDDLDEVNIAAQINISDEIVDTEPVVMTLESVDTATDIITLEGERLLFELGDRVTVTTGDSPTTTPGGIDDATDYYVIPYQMKDAARLRLASSLANAMDNIYIDITSSGSGTISVTKTGEPRYHGAGVVDTALELGVNLNDILNSIAGRAVCVGGKWNFYAGAWREPEVELGIGDQSSDMTFRSAIPLSERGNIMRGLFLSSLNNYQQDDYPAAIYQTFIDQDNGKEYYRDLNLPFTNRPTTAQRIAKIELFKARQEIVFSSSYKMIAFSLHPGETAMQTIDEFGWAQKPFEVTQFSLSVDEGALNNNITFRETAEAIFDWTSGEAITYDPAPNTNLPDAFSVTAPSGVNFSSRSVGTQQGDLVYSLVLLWDTHPNSFVTQNGSFELQFKLSSDVDWKPSFFVDGAITESELLTASVNTQYDLRIRARNHLGVKSSFVTILNAIVGSSGGVGTTDDWRLFSESISVFKDWEDFSNDSPLLFEDWGFFT